MLKAVLTAISFVAVLTLTQFAMAGIIVPVVSTFDNDLDGWLVDNMPNGSVVWDGSGGNPGGYAHFADEGPTRSYLVAPAKFLGDWSNLDGVGELSYGHILLVHGSDDTNLAFTVKLSGPGGSATWSDPTAPTTSWQTLTSSISSSDWNVTSGTWASLLADVTSLSISIEAMDNASGSLDRDGMDNITLRQTPEPATLSLLGVAAMALLRRRK